MTLTDENVVEDFMENLTFTQTQSIRNFVDESKVYYQNKQDQEAVITLIKKLAKDNTNKIYLIKTIRVTFQPTFLQEIFPEHFKAQSFGSNEMVSLKESKEFVEKVILGDSE